MFSTATVAPISARSHLLLLHIPLLSPLSFDSVGFRLLRSSQPCYSTRTLPGRYKASIYPVTVKLSSRRRCSVESTATEDQLRDSETKPSGIDDGEESEGKESTVTHNVDLDNYPRSSYSQPSDVLSLGIPEPVYEVVEVKLDGVISTKKIYRRHLLKTSGLRPRDIRSVDPSLWLTNSVPCLLVREHAILLNLGSLRAIVMQEHVLIFNYNRKGGKAFIDSLLPRLNPKNTNVGQSMPFVLEVIEAALVSRIQRLERRMMHLEPRVSMEAQFKRFLKFFPTA